MREEYKQMELDTRKQLDKAIQTVAEDAVRDIEEMAIICGEAPTPVRNRHEAYGIAAEHFAKINNAVKAIQKDTATLLVTLPDPNYPAIEAVSSICNSTMAAVAKTVRAAAEMRRTLRDLYAAENSGGSDPTPMEQLTELAQFQNADPVGTDEDETEE